MGFVPLALLTAFNAKAKKFVKNVTNRNHDLWTRHASAKNSGSRKEVFAYAGPTSLTRQVSVFLANPWSQAASRAAESAHTTQTCYFSANLLKSDQTNNCTLLVTSANPTRTTTGTLNSAPHVYPHRLAVYHATSKASAHSVLPISTYNGKIKSAKIANCMTPSVQLVMINNAWLVLVGTPGFWTLVYGSSGD
jgi:hypothetical protein